MQTQPASPEPPESIDRRVEALALAARLSSREIAVLRLIVLGYRYREIASAIEISPRTVKMHAANVRRKVGGVSRWDLMRRVLAA